MAAALLITAGLAVGVTAGPTAATGAIGGHSGLASDDQTNRAGPSGWLAPVGGRRAAQGKPTMRVRSAQATGIAYPLASESAGRPGSRAQGRQRAGSGAKPTGTTRPSPSPSQSAAPQQPIEIYDSAAPGAIPAGVMCATYATGHYSVPAAEMAGRPTIWIDAWGTDPAASVLDVEPGDATPSMVPAWVAQHLAIDGSANARIYTMLNEWSAIQQAVSTLPSWMRARIRWWIADPTGVPHMVTGASATQWYWGSSYDISTANPGF
jgi:hypothetical protein